MKFVLILLGALYVNAALYREDETDESDGSGTEEVKDEKTKVFPSDIMAQIAYLLEEKLNKRNAFLEAKISLLEETINTNIDSLRSELTKLGSGESQTCSRQDVPVEGNTAALITKFEAQVDKAKGVVSGVSMVLKREIREDPNLTDDEKIIQKTQVTQNENKINKGLDHGIVGYKRTATEAREAKEGKDRDTKLKVLEILNGVDSEESPSPGAKPSKGEKLGTVIGAINKGVTQLKIIMDPKKTWQERTAAGFTVVSDLIGLLPPPFGVTGSAIFSLIGAFFGVSSPTKDEYAKLRKEILSGVRDLLDEQQIAEAMGCLNRIEFLGGILDMHDDADASKLMTEEEFFAVILAGGIDIGVASLGTFKYKMDQYRDKNTIIDGRRALEMAHYYVLIAEQRDMLNRQILSYINVSGGAGFTARFFGNTKKLAHRDYQNLFFWEEICCEKDDKYFSALLTYNLPLKKHAGAGKAVAVVSKFIKDCRTNAYYDDAYNGISKDTALSYDTPKAVTGESADVLYSMAERPPEVDSEYYKYHNWKVPGRYLGQGTESLGDSTAEGAFGRFLPLKIKCDSNNNSITRFGVDSTYTVKIQFVESPDVGDPRAANISLKSDSGDEFFITKGLTLKSKDAVKYKNLVYTPHDMLVSCVNGEKKYGKEVLKQAKMRLFRVKLSTFVHPKFLISPLAEDSGETLYFMWSGLGPPRPLVGRDTVYTLKELPSVPSEDTALTPALLTKDRSDWKELWFLKVYLSPGESTRKASGGIAQVEVNKLIDKTYRIEGIMYYVYILGIHRFRVRQQDDNEMFFDSSTRPGGSEYTGPYEGQSSFTLVQGLAGTGTVSFMLSKDHTKYIRWKGNGRCYCEAGDGSTSFNESASFIIHTGLYTMSETSYSFESYNSPGYYILHKNFVLKISIFSDHPKIFKDTQILVAASWVMKPK